MCTFGFVVLNLKEVIAFADVIQFFFFPLMHGRIANGQLYKCYYAIQYYCLYAFVFLVFCALDVGKNHSVNST